MTYIFNSTPAAAAFCPYCNELFRLCATPKTRQACTTRFKADLFSGQTCRPVAPGPLHLLLNSVHRSSGPLPPPFSSRHQVHVSFPAESLEADYKVLQRLFTPKYCTDPTAFSWEEKKRTA